MEGSLICNNIYGKIVKKQLVISSRPHSVDQQQAAGIGSGEGWVGGG
jgi:hypothetical protein